MTDIPVISGTVSARLITELLPADALADTDIDFVSQAGVLRQTTIGAKRAHFLATVSLTWGAITGKPTTFAPSAHTHIIDDVTGLSAALAAR